MSITLILIILTSGISVYAWSHQDLLEKWVFHPFSIDKRNQWYRFITSGFLHADWTHLFFNMLSLYFFGEAVERVFNTEGDLKGIALYLLIYVGGMIIADVPTYIKHKKDFDYRALGASGAVSAIIFSSILFNPLQKIYIFFIPIGIPGFIFGFIYLIYSYYEAQRVSGINHSAHFYGAVFGFVISFLMVEGAGLNFMEQISRWRIF